MKTLNKITFHNGSQAYVQNKMTSLGKKTKILFAQELLKEWESIESKDHQYMLLSDVIRVADKLKI
jgi:hypothetical protein